MAKIRVYELAKQLKLSSKELIKMLAELGVETKNHMSTISEKEANAVMELINEEQTMMGHYIIEDEHEEKAVKKAKSRKPKGKPMADGNTAGIKDPKSPVAAKKPAGGKTVEIGAEVTVKGLAETLGVPATQIIKRLIPLGIMAGLNQNIDGDIAAEIGREYGFELG